MRLIVQRLIDSINFIEDLESDKLNANEDIKSLYDIRDILKKRDIDEENIKRCIDEYNKIANKIWEDYLSNSSQHRYLVHNVGQREFYESYEPKTISTSLISDKQAAFYHQMAKGFPNGFIIQPKHIVSATTYDNSIDNENGGLDYGMRMIQLPYELEHRFIENEKKRGTYLNFKNVREIVFGGECNEIACDQYEITGYFFVSFGEGRLSPVYEKAKRMSDGRNLKLVEIDFSRIREKNGLDPLSESMKKDLFQRLLTRRAVELRNKNPMQYYPLKDVEYVEKNFENFAKKYLILRDTKNFNEANILKIFRETLLDYEYEEHKKNPRYSIGLGLYIDELSKEDEKYLELIKEDKEINTDKCINFTDIGKETISEYKKDPNNIEDRIKYLRDQILREDFSR